MTMTLQQFKDSWFGKPADFDGYYGPQCVDLFNFYNRDVVGAPWIGTPVTGYAKDLWYVDNSARNQHYLILPADSAFRPGDVLVYDNNYGGHVAIYLGNDQVLQQNVNNRRYVTIDPASRHGLLGVLRPKVFLGDAIAPATPAEATKLITITPGFTMWYYEHVNHISHGTLQRLNPQLDPRQLQIGAQIRVPA